MLYGIILKCLTTRDMIEHMMKPSDYLDVLAAVAAAALSQVAQHGLGLVLLLQRPLVEEGSHAGQSYVVPVEHTGLQDRTTEFRTGLCGL